MGAFGIEAPGPRLPGVFVLIIKEGMTDRRGTYYIGSLTVGVLKKISSNLLLSALLDGSPKSLMFSHSYPTDLVKHAN